MAGANKVLSAEADVTSYQALLAMIITVTAQLNAVINDLETLRGAASAHTHIENTAAAYTQNATTGASTAVLAGALTASKLTRADGSVIT